MAQMSDYLENALINAVLRATAFTSPATIYLALYTADPTDAKTGAEVTGGSYARQSIAFNAPTNGASTNSAQVSFASMPAVTVTHVGLLDAATAGNLLFHGALASSKIVAAGNTFLVAAGDITVTLA